MKKNIFLMLGLFLLSISLVVCGEKNDLLGQDYSSKSNIKGAHNNTDNSGKESSNTTYPSHKNSVESKEKHHTKNELFSVVELNTVGGVCNYYLDGLKVTRKIEPSNNTGNYSDYEVKNQGNIYIDAIIEMENLSDIAVKPDYIITAKIKINSNEYKCFSVVESADSNNFEKDVSLKPLESRKTHYVVEVPKTEANGEIEIILTVNGKDLSNNFDLEGAMP